MPPSFLKFTVFLLFLAAPAFSAARRPTGPAYAPGELLVRFKSSVSETGRGSLHARLGSSLIRRLERLGVDHLHLAAGQSVTMAAAAYLASGLVEFAEPNYVVHALVGPDDPLLQPSGLRSQQWYYQRIQADRAFSTGFTFTATVTVAVVDTGYTPSHNDLPTPVVNPGQNFVDPLNPNNIIDGDGHGTMVSGIIAALTNNGIGIAGVGFSNVQIMPLKALDDSGNGTDASIAAAMEYAAAHGARVINLSLGSTSASSTLQVAVNDCYAAGCLIVAAAGNDGGAVEYPAAYPHVVSVSALDNAATTSSSMLTSYSNFGRVDLSAPGGNAVDGDVTVTCAGSCTVPGFATEIVSTTKPGPDTYEAEAGTSFACPQVAATGALLFAQDNSRTPDEVTFRMEETADATGEGAAANGRAGWGQVDVYNALAGVRPASQAAALKTYNWPNPFNPNRETSYVAVILPQSADTRVRIYDAAGNAVLDATVPAANTSTGLNPRLFAWNGHNAAGLQVANGIYILVVDAAGARAVNRIAVSK